MTFCRGTLSCRRATILQLGLVVSAFAGGSGLLARGAALGGTLRGSALVAALLGGAFVLGLPAAATALLAAVVAGVDRRPGPAFGFLRGRAPFLVAFFDVLGLALLFVRVLGFVT